MRCLPSNRFDELLSRPLSNRIKECRCFLRYHKLIGIIKLSVSLFDLFLKYQILIFLPTGIRKFVELSAHWANVQFVKTEWADLFFIQLIETAAEVV